MDTYMLLNLTIGFSGVFLCLLGLLQVAACSWIDRRTGRYFLRFFLFLLLFAVSNAAGQLMRGRPGPGWRALLYLSNFLEYFLPVVLAATATWFLLYILDPQEGRKGVRRAVAALLCAHAALLVLSQFTGLFYVIDAGNYYQRSQWYPLSYLAGAAMLCMDMALLLRDGGRLSRRERTAFWICFAVPFASMVAQLFVYGVFFVVFATILAGLAMYVFLLGEQTRRYLQQEKQLSDMRVRMLFNQIRPHFIFNVLTSIYVLCRDDPARAMEVTQDFSEYLHSNFTAMAAEDLISFSDELRHTRAYLAVESIRYGDRLTVDYDIRHTAFRLPALTLQPLVENAVKYGVGCGRGPGQIVIRSEAGEDGAVITVEDNGPGFDPAEAESGGHVGIRNVRERLARMCAGTLEIASSPGFGTVATVRIPFEKKGPERSGPARGRFSDVFKGLSHINQKKENIF